MKNVEVGMFKLPGISFSQGELPAELNEEMKAWAEAEGVGMSMTESLWSFKKESHRDWFILKWIDRIPKPEEKHPHIMMPPAMTIPVVTPKKSRKPRAKKTTP